MSIRPLLIAGSILAASTASGCGPMMMKNQENRDAANARIAALNAEIAHDQALQFFETGQFDKAESNITLAVGLQPEIIDNRVLHARILIEMHKLEQANIALENALELEPGHAEAAYYHGIVFQRWSDDERAFESYKAAYDAEPSEVAYLLAAAEMLVSLEREEDAKQLIYERLDYFEHNWALRFLLGNIALIQERPGAAADLFAEAWRFNPEDISVLEQLADAQFVAGRYDDCLNSIQQLRNEIGSADPDVVEFEARCLAMLDRLDASMEVYLELSRLTPRDPEAWADLGAVAWESGDFHHTALAGARLTQLAPDRFEGYLLKAVNEHHHGNLEEAIELFEQSTRHADDQVLPLLMLGKVLEDSGDKEGAHDAYTQALTIEPSSREAAWQLQRLTAHHVMSAPLEHAVVEGREE